MEGEPCEPLQVFYELLTWVRTTRSKSFNLRNSFLVDFHSHGFGNEIIFEVQRVHRRAKSTTLLTPLGELPLASVEDVFIY